MRGKKGLCVRNFSSKTWFISLVGVASINTSLPVSVAQYRPPYLQRCKTHVTSLNRLGWFLLFWQCCHLLGKMENYCHSQIQHDPSVLKWIVADLIFKTIFNVILFLKVNVLSPHLERPAGGDGFLEGLDRDEEDLPEEADTRWRGVSMAMRTP